MLKNIIKFLRKIFSTSTDLTIYRKQIIKFKVELHQVQKSKDFYRLRDIFIRIDTLLFRVCKILGCGKESVGEQLRSDRVKRLLTKKVLDLVWTFHKIRNRIVHDDYIPTEKDIYYAAKTVQVLEKLVK